MYKIEESLTNFEIKQVGLSNKVNNNLTDLNNSIKLFDQKFMLHLDNYTNIIKQLDKYKEILQVKH